MRIKLQVLPIWVSMILILLAIPVARFSNAQSVGPGSKVIPADPAPPLPTPAPAPAPVAAQAPIVQPQPQQIVIPPVVAQAFKTAIEALPQKDEGILKSLASWLSTKMPQLSALALIVGWIRTAGFPVHTAIDQYLQKRLSPERYAKIHTDGSTVFKQFDWIVNLIFSVKPSAIMAAFGTRAAKAMTPPPGYVLVPAAAAPSAITRVDRLGSDVAYMPPEPVKVPTEPAKV